MKILNTKLCYGKKILVSIWNSWNLEMLKLPRMSKLGFKLKRKHAKIEMENGLKMIDT